MKRWPLNIDLGSAALAEAAPTPIFQQIAEALLEAAAAGRISAGEALPGTRTLADQLGVHRNTVVAAYAELAAQGWIETSKGRGSFLAAALPDGRKRTIGRARARVPGHVGFALSAAPTAAPENDLGPGGIVFADGVPDLRLAPAELLARAYRRAVRARGGAVLGYGDARGHHRLRAALADMLGATRGLACGGGEILVTRGSQMAIALVARALVARGDAVAVEALGYRPAWSAFQSAGAELLPVPVDRHGMKIDRLAELAKRGAIRAVYVTPHHQYPTLATMSASRRLALLDVAARERIAVIEDDYDNEFHYRGRPVLPLASADRAGVVLYVGTLSKVVAPGVRVGYVVAPSAVIDKLASERLHLDRQGDPAIECAIAELLEDGELARHVRRMRRIYQRRRDVLIEALGESLGDDVRFEVPAGGMALWLRAPGIDVDAWAAAARERGVSFRPGRSFAFDGRPRRSLRLAFASSNEDEIREGVARMASALAAVRRG